MEAYDETEEKFTLIENGLLDFSNAALFTSISENKQWACVSTAERTYIYVNFTQGDISQAQSLPSSTLNKFTKNGE